MPKDYLNCCFDESNNIKGDRVMNLSVSTEKGGFFESNTDLGTATVRAEFCADLAEKRLQTVTRGKMNRVNSLWTDTCSPMLSAAAALKDWTRDPRITGEARKSQELRTVISLIQNPRFWLHLAELSDAISPTYKHQVMAQTDHAHIGYVRGRWGCSRNT
jgi:hypothetical protein